MREAIDNFYLSQPEPLRGCLLAMRDIILEAQPQLQEDWKYKMPCFTLNSKHFCYLWKDKKTLNPYMLMVDGGLIDHPALVQKDRKRMKVVMVDVKADLPVQEIQEVLALGIELRKK